MSPWNVLACLSLIVAAATAAWWVNGGGLLAMALALFALVCPLVVLIVMRLRRDAEGGAPAADRDRR